MNSIGTKKRTIRKISKKIVTALVGNMLIMVFFLAFFYCNFETNDDYFMKMIVSGAYGHPDSHLIFINSMLGILLRALYTFTSSVPWYELFQYVLIYISLSVITYVLTEDENTSFLNDVLVYSVIFSSAHFLYVDLQFTKTTAILAVAGYVLLSFSIEKNRNGLIPLSVVLIVISIMLRKNQFLYLSFISAPLYLPLIIDFAKNRKEGFGRIKKLVVSALVCLLCLFVSNLANKAYYSGSNWESFTEFNRIRATVLDREVMDYSSDSAFYDKLGLNDVDVQMLQLWNCDDPEVFTTDVLRAIAEEQLAHQKSLLSVIGNFINDAVRFFIQDSNCLSVMIVFISALLLFIGSKKDISSIISVVICLMALAGGTFYTYYYRGCAFLERVHLSAVIATIFVIVYRTRTEYSRNTSTAVSTMLAFAIITVFFCLMWTDGLRITSTKKIRDDQKIAAISQIKNDSDHVYVRTTDESLDYISGILLNNDSYAEDNIFPLGGWMTGSPIRDEVKRKYNIENPFRDIIDNDKAYLIVSDQDRFELILEYIRRHYSDSIKAVLIKKIEANKEYTVYSIVTD